MKPEPKYGGKMCVGEAKLVEKCQLRKCSQQVNNDNMKFLLETFELTCFMNPWILDCDPYEYSSAYVFLFDEIGNFLELTDNGVIAIKPVILRPKRLSRIMTREQNPNYLFKIIWCEDHNGFHIKSGDGSYLGVKRVSNIFKIEFAKEKMFDNFLTNLGH